MSVTVPRVTLPGDSAKSPQIKPPSQRQPWGFFATLAWVLLAAFIAILGLIPILLMFEGAGVALEGPIVELVLYFDTALMLLVLAQAARIARWPVHAYFALFAPKKRDIWFGLAVFVIWTAISAILFDLLGLGEADAQWFIGEYRKAQRTGILGFFWISTIIVAPISEEAIFRGFIFRGWAQSWLGIRGTMLLTSALFGLIHVQYTWAGMFDCALFGLIAGWMRWRTGNIVLPILLHFADNFVAILYAMSKA